MNLSSDATAAIQAALQAAAHSSTVEAFKHVLLENGPKGFSALGTDGNLQVRSQCAALNGAAFSVQVPADRLSKIIGTARGEIDISLTAKSISVKMGASRFALPLYLVGEFPSMPEDTKTAEIQVPAADFLAALDRVSPFAADKDIRYMLTAVYLEWREGRLFLVGGDGSGMGVESLPVAGDPAFQGMLPKHLVRRVRGLLAKADMLTLSLGRRLTLTCGEVCIDANLIDGQYVNWRRPMRTEHDARPVVLAGEAAAVFSDSLITAAQSRLGLCGTIEFNTDGLKVTSEGEDGRGFDGLVVCKVLSGKPMSADFNLTVLKEIFSLFPKEAEVEIGLMTAAGTALFFTSPSVPDYTAVYMPMRG